MSAGLDLIAAVFARHAGRTCFGERAPGAPRFAPVTYAEVWARAVDLASGWAHLGLVRPGDFVGICGFASIDWMVADLACLYAGAVSVPLQPSLPEDALHHVIADAGLACVVCSAADLGRLPEVPTVIVMDGPGAGLPIGAVEARGRAGGAVPPVRRGADAIVNITYTSGSSARPRGVVYRDGPWAAFLRSSAGTDAPVTVGYLPLCHILGRGLVVYRTLVSGGAVYFTGARDLSTLLEDIRLVRPTVLAVLPRVSGLIFQHFQTELVRRGGGPGAAAEVMAGMRGRFLGDRLRGLFSSGAPTPPEILAFLERCFGVPVLDHYGSTDLGPIATNGRILPGIAYKVVDAPELGYRTSDQPYPRGELAIRAPDRRARYFKDAAADRAAVDADGYLRTGDIVELRGAGHIAVVDRRHNIVKLAQGEFVSPARLEEIFRAEIPFIAQIYVHAEPLRAFLLAVVVPNVDAVGAALGAEAGDAGAVKRLVRAEIDRVARAARLPAHEVPRDLLVEPRPFTTEDGLLTEAGKPRRAGLRAAYQPALDALYRTIEGRQVAGAPGGSVTVAAQVVAAVAATLGLGEAEVELERSFVGLGGDSLGAVALCERLEQAVGRAPSVGSVLAPTTSIAALVAELERTPGPVTFATIHGRDARVVAAADVRVERFLPGLAAPGPPPARAPDAVLLTGATGFLGRNLLGALVERGVEVHCLVRGADDAAALARLGGAGGRIVAHAGDVTRPGLGLAPGVHDALAERVAAILHGAALVNHALAYPRLFEPNVLGTAQVARFALARRHKAIGFVSSSAAVAGVARTAPVLEDEPLAALLPRRPIGDRPGDVAVGYGTSKWAAELLLADLHRRCGTPVAVFRCSTILPHRSRVDANPGDLVVRLLAAVRATGLAPPSLGARHFDGVPVDVAAGAIATLAVDGGGGWRTFHVCNDRWDDGVSLDRLVDWMGGVRRLPDHATWLAAVRAAVGARAALFERWADPDAGPALRLDASALRVRLGPDAIPALDEAYLHHLVRALPP